MRRVGSGCLEMAVARQRAAAREMTHSSWRRAAGKGWARAGFRRCEIGPEAGADRRRVFPWSTLFLEPGHAICLGLVTPFILAGSVSLCVSQAVYIYGSLRSLSLCLCLVVSRFVFLCLCLSLFVFVSVSISLSLSLCVFLGLCLSVSLCLCLSLSLSLSPSVSLSLSFPLSLTPRAVCRSVVLCPPPSSLL